MIQAREQILENEKKKLVKKLCLEKRIPRIILSQAYDIVAEVQKGADVIPNEGTVMRLIGLVANNKFLRWQFKKNSYQQRLKLLTGPDSKLEAQMESTVEGLLIKGRLVSLNQITKMAETYMKIPPGVARPLARKVIHRVRERHRWFRSEKNTFRMFRRYSIPGNDFIALVRAAILRPSTPPETLETVGKVLQHLYHVAHRLRE